MTFAPIGFGNNIFMQNQFVPQTVPLGNAYPMYGADFGINNVSNWGSGIFTLPPVSLFPARTSFLNNPVAYMPQLSFAPTPSLFANNTMPLFAQPTFNPFAVQSSRTFDTNKSTTVVTDSGMKKHAQLLMGKYKKYYAEHGITEEKLLGEIKLACDTAKKYGVDEKLVLSVIEQESVFDPKAGSYRGAQGLMQLMPSTAKGLKVKNAWDPAQNIDGGVRLLRDLLKRYNGNVSLALAAYNAGPKRVDKCGGVPNIAETKKYVAIITENYKKYSVA